MAYVGTKQLIEIESPSILMQSVSEFLKCAASHGFVLRGVALHKKWFWINCDGFAA